MLSCSAAAKLAGSQARELATGELQLRDMDQGGQVTAKVQAHKGLVNSLDCCGGQVGPMPCMCTPQTTTTKAIQKLLARLLGTHRPCPMRVQF